MDMIVYYERAAKDFLGVCDISISWKYIYTKDTQKFYEIILNKNYSLECFILICSRSIYLLQDFYVVSGILKCILYSIMSFNYYISYYDIIFNIIEEKKIYKRTKKGIKKFFTLNQLQQLKDIYEYLL